MSEWKMAAANYGLAFVGVGSLIVVWVAFLVIVSSPQEPTVAPSPSATWLPTETDTPVPTATDTPIPTNTPEPTATNTPIPTPTPRPQPTTTPAPPERTLRITYYGQALADGPMYCGTDVYGRFDPSDPTTATGVKLGYDCGTRLELCADSCIVVIVKDKCGGCGPNHIDVSHAAYHALGEPTYVDARELPQ